MLSIVILPHVPLDLISLVETFLEGIRSSVSCRELTRVAVVLKMEYIAFVNIIYHTYHALIILCALTFEI